MITMCLLKIIYFIYIYIYTVTFVGTGLIMSYLMVDVTESTSE